MLQVLFDKPSAVALGNFDGLHKGHAAVINASLSYAKEGLVPLVLLFEPHPEQVIYGIAPAKRGFLKPAGQWNQEEIVADGSRIKVTLNGTVILEADLSKIDKPMDGQPHPGLHNAKGHIGWLGHGDPVAFRNVRIKEIGARD